MADKVADIHTLAPRLSYVEDLAAWLKDNRGEGGSGTIDQKLWQATLTGSETGGTWGDEPWLATDLIYGPGSTNEVSMHQTVFGTDPTGALRCQDGKGLYGWLFPVDETRWQQGPQNDGRHLSTDIFSGSESGYVHSLRAASLSLMSAVFKSPEYVGDYTIIDRIIDITTELESLATNFETEIENLNATIDEKITTRVEAAVGTQLNDIQTFLDDQFAGLDSLGIGPLHSIIDHMMIRINQLENSMG